VLAAVFDEYRITQVELWASPDFTQAAETVPEPMEWVTVVDLDNAATPSSLGALYGKPGALVSGPFQSHYHRFRPRLAVAAYNGAFGGFVDTNEVPWVDCSNTNVQYYGMKLGTSTCSSAFHIIYKIRYVVEFRGISPG
jgi:hypothetical protein